MAYNIWNSGKIESYLRDIAEKDERLGDLLCAALIKPLKKRPENIVVTTTLPQKAPQWLRNKWDGQSEWHAFKPDRGLRPQIEHIYDWIKGAVIRREDWLEDLNEQGVPKKLAQIGTFDRAVNLADKAMARQAQQARRHFEELATAAEDKSKTVKKFKDGFRIVQMFSPTALDYESAMMGHCVGNGSYDSRLHNGYEYFSLRGPDNKPHATIEIDTRRNRLLQCKGKRNAPPVLKYQPYIRAFIKDKNCSLAEDTANTGLVKHKGRYYSIARLPKNCVVNGDLDLTNMDEDLILPEGLEVRGRLYLNGEQFSAPPRNVNVQKNIRLLWRSKGVLHRDDDLPALRVYGGLSLKLEQEEWWRHGERHRDGDQPAAIHYGWGGRRQNEYWYRDGKKHREGDKPASILRSADCKKPYILEWKRDGKFHRDSDKPSYVILSRLERRGSLDNRQLTWYKDNKRHRENGLPAIVVSDIKTRDVIEARWCLKNEDVPLSTKFAKYALLHDEMVPLIVDAFASAVKNATEETHPMQNKNVIRLFAELAKKSPQHDRQIARLLIDVVKKATNDCDWDTVCYVSRHLKERQDRYDMPVESLAKSAPAP